MSQLIIALIILAIATILFLSNRVRADLVALLVVVALGLTGILTPQEAFSGFSRTAVITIMSIFILAEGLQRTGVTEQVGNLLLRIAGNTESRLVVTVMTAGAFLSLFMNNIAAASVLLPAVSGAARKAKVYPSRLLMPLAFSTILGGMATLLTTTNIVVSSLLRDQGIEGFGLLDFAPVGVPVVIAGVVYMAVWGRRRLPTHSLTERVRNKRREESDLVDFYRLGEHLFRVRVPGGSSLIGKTLIQSTFRETYGLNVVAVERNGQEKFSPSPDTVLDKGDILLLEGNLEEFRQRDVEPYLEILPPRHWSDQDLETDTVFMIETMLPPRSALINQTLRSAHFREKYGMNVLAIWRAGEQIYEGLADLPLQFGDAMLLQGQRERVEVLRDEPDIIVLAYEEEQSRPVPGKGHLAMAIMCLTLIIAAIKPQIVSEIMLGGALAMMVAGMLTMDEAYQAIDWKSVFIVACMLPMGLAMTKTGASALLANGMISMLGPTGPLVLLAGLFILTVLMTQAINGAAVAAVVAPVAIRAAQQIGANPRAFAMGVALATSMAFLTPLGHPVSVLVMGPAGYSFRDYFKAGFPLTLIILVVVMTLLPLFWPL